MVGEPDFPLNSTALTWRLRNHSLCVVAATACGLMFSFPVSWFASVQEEGKAQRPTHRAAALISSNEALSCHVVLMLCLPRAEAASDRS